MMDIKRFGLFFASGILAFEVIRKFPAILRWVRNLQLEKSKLKKTNKCQIQPSKFEVIDDPALELRKPHKIWNTAIFFPVDPTLLSPKTELLYYFEHAAFSIRMCMHLSSLYEIRDIVLQKKREGLLVQVITDYDTLVGHNNWNCKVYIRAGIPVRARNTGRLMHNKFVIIDDEAVMTGSLNQTKQAVNQNDENVVITTNKKLVGCYIQEFENIWQTVDDITLAVFR